MVLVMKTQETLTLSLRSHCWAQLAQLRASAPPPLQATDTINQEPTDREAGGLEAWPEYS